MNKYYIISDLGRYLANTPSKDDAPIWIPIPEEAKRFESATQALSCVDKIQPHPVTYQSMKSLYKLLKD